MRRTLKQGLYLLLVVGMVGCARLSPLPDVETAPLAAAPTETGLPASTETTSLPTVPPPTATPTPAATTAPPPTATPSPTPPLTPTDTPSQALAAGLLPSEPVTAPPVDWTPTRPAAFDVEKDTQASWVREYIQTVTNLLNMNTNIDAQARVDAALAQLVTWMPADSTYEGPLPPNAWTVARDLNADDKIEWLISVPARDRGCWATYCPAYVLIFEMRDNLFVPAAILIEDENVWDLSDPKLLMVADINADGHLEVVIEQVSCGAHTCFTGIIIGQWNRRRWRSLTADPVMQAYTDYTIVDQTGDGLLDIVMHGGMYGSVGAGLQRPHTQVFAWRDGAYRLVEDTPDPDEHPYFQMLDANAALANGEWDTTLNLALAIVNYPGVYEDEGWLTTETWARIVGYATLEAMFVYAQQGSVEAMRQAHAGLLSRSASAPNDPYPDAAWQVLQTYEATGDPLAACLAAEDFIAARAEDAAFFEWYGYGMERLTLDRICPLDHATEEGPQL
ncbi:MAG: hypothetical protein JXR84_12840 [Anaerolineae bacterium]|nr:hypothetical protein [Anaerolineae bacterium]